MINNSLINLFGIFLITFILIGLSYSLSTNRKRNNNKENFIGSSYNTDENSLLSETDSQFVNENQIQPGSRCYTDYKEGNTNTGNANCSEEFPKCIGGNQNTGQYGTCIKENKNNQDCKITCGNNSPQEEIIPYDPPSPGHYNPSDFSMCKLIGVNSSSSNNNVIKYNNSKTFNKYWYDASRHCINDPKCASFTIQTEDIGDSKGKVKFFDNIKPTKVPKGLWEKYGYVNMYYKRKGPCLPDPCDQDFKKHLSNNKSSHTQFNQKYHNFVDKRQNQFCPSNTNSGIPGSGYNPGSSYNPGFVPGNNPIYPGNNPDTPGGSPDDPFTPYHKLIPHKISDEETSHHFPHLDPSHIDNQVAGYNCDIKGDSSMVNGNSQHLVSN